MGCKIVQTTSKNLSIEDAISQARHRYIELNPKSAAAYEAAKAVMPGGSTRSVLHFEPFPLTMESGSGAEVWDIDGHHYHDFVGEFSAGLYGHSDPVIANAIDGALRNGIVMAAPTMMEQRLASVIHSRFSSMEHLRFCNSGTEANILAIVTARVFTGRSKILVFREAYHGGVLTFAGGGSPMNVPFEFLLGDYNNIVETVELIRKNRADLAAVIVEPILGAAGNIPGCVDFLQALRDETAKCGALLIFDEIKTSRCGAGGIQGMIGIKPDLTTLGKYVGGGLPCGVFGGRRDIMDCFNPNGSRRLRHAGTFNNNVCSMAAGYAGLTEVFTPERAEEFFSTCERFRQDLNEKMISVNVPIQFVGLGSMFTVHFSSRPIVSPAHISGISRQLAVLFHLECLLSGVLVAARGDVFMSLPVNETHKTRLSEAILRFVDTFGHLIRKEVAALS